MEDWKDIKGYEGEYQISSCGRVRSLKTNRVLKLYEGDYSRVCLCKNGVKKTWKVHRLVADAFIPNPDNLPEINHKDENKYNNCVENLEWCSKVYNNNYGTKTERTEDTKRKNRGGDASAA